MFSIELKNLKSDVDAVLHSHVFNRNVEYTLAALPAVLYTLAYLVITVKGIPEDVHRNVLHNPAVMSGLHLTQMIVFLFLSYRLTARKADIMEEAGTDTLKKYYGVNITTFNMHREKAGILLRNTEIHWDVCTVFLSLYYSVIVLKHTFHALELEPFMSVTQFRLLQAFLLLAALHRFYTVYLLINRGRIWNGQVYWPQARKRTTFLVILLFMTHSVVVSYTRTYPDHLLYLSSHSALLVTGGMFLLYFNGRLDNHFINPNGFIKTAFYFTPFVLMVSGVLKIHPFDMNHQAVIKHTFSVLMLYLKTFIAVYIIWLYKSGRLMDYIVRLRIFRESKTKIKKQQNLKR